MEDLISPLLVSMDDDFGIGLGSKDMSAGFQFAPQLQKIIDLAIKHDPYGLFLIRHRLVATAEINDRKTPKAEAKRAGKEKSFIIWASMNQRPSHPLNVIEADGALILKIVLAANTTHRVSFPCKRPIR